MASTLDIGHAMILCFAKISASHNFLFLEHVGDVSVAPLIYSVFFLALLTALLPAFSIST